MSIRAAIELFSRHKNAANLLFFSMIMLGVFGLLKLNTQFFPTVEVNIVSIQIPWPGASAQDVDKNIVATVQPEVRFIDGVKEFSAQSRLGLASMTVEFLPGTEMQRALGDVEAAVNGIVTLPKDSERPLIAQTLFYEPVASIMVSGDFDERSLRSYAKEIRDGLLNAGVDKITMSGFRDEEIWVETRSSELRRYDMTTSDIGGKIAASSLDTPGGVLRGDIEQQVRSVGLALTAREVADINLRNSADGSQIQVKDVASVYETFDSNSATGWTKDQRAIRLTILRTKNADALRTTEIARTYLDKIVPTLPPTLNVQLFDVVASKILQRINVLLYNGLTGMVLVLGILFLFLNGRIAIWVAAGIPASMMATFGVMWALDLSINMLSMFALIMTVGIIVDDAIVVGEHSATLTAQGLDAKAAAEGGAIRMTMPIIAAALTTLAAFIPMLLIGDTVGQIVRPIPLVLFCVLVASLIECFLVLPGHLSHALAKPARAPSGFKKRFNEKFEAFRDGRLRRFVTMAYDNRYTTLSVGLAVLMICVGLMSGGRVNFRFFPSPEGEVVKGYVFFQPGTSREETRAGVRLIEQALYDSSKELDVANEGLVDVVFTQIGRTEQSYGDDRGYIYAELKASELRTVRTKEIVKAWEEALPDIANIRYVFIREQRGGPPGRDIDIRLEDGPPDVLKKAAIELRLALEEYPGISRARDNLSYNKQELLLDVNDRGAALGFTNQIVGNLTRGSLQGMLAKRFARDDQEVTIRVLQPRTGERPKQLEDILLPVPGTLPARYVPLTAVVNIDKQPGFSTIRRIDGKVAVSVVADYDDNAGNPNEVIRALEKTALPAITNKYNLQYSLGGRAEEQASTFQGLIAGAIIGLGLIYVILAFVFASYSRPVIIMSVIPFGLVGTTLGHYFQGYDLTFLSFVGLLGLSGILVNNSIILISRIEERRSSGEALRDAVINGICDRFRAVILTSLTTVLGLAPLLFETSVQAQFLLPMVITIAWGLAFASFIVLLLVPSVLGMQEDIRSWSRRSRGHRGDDATPEAAE